MCDVGIMIWVMVMVCINLKGFMLFSLFNGVLLIFISILMGIFCGCLGKFVSCINSFVWFEIFLFMLIILLEYMFMFVLCMCCRVFKWFW